MSTLSLTKEARICSREKIASSISHAEKTGQLRGKESACSAGDLGLIPGLGRSPGGSMTFHSGILAWRIPMDRGAWWAIVLGITTE